MSNKQQNPQAITCLGASDIVLSSPQAEQVANIIKGHIKRDNELSTNRQEASSEDRGRKHEMPQGGDKRPYQPWSSWLYGVVTRITSDNVKSEEPLSKDTITDGPLQNNEDPNRLGPMGTSLTLWQIAHPV